MHELSITQNIVAIVAERAAGRPVRKVTLRVGALAGVDTRAVAFCFDVCAKGSALEGAALEIERVPGQARCTECGLDVPLDHLVAICPCERRARLELTQGNELLVHSMEV